MSQNWPLISHAKPWEVSHVILRLFNFEQKKKQSQFQFIFCRQVNLTDSRCDVMDRYKAENNQLLTLEDRQNLNAYHKFATIPTPRWFPAHFVVRMHNEFHDRLVLSVKWIMSSWWFTWWFWYLCSTRNKQAHGIQRNGIFAFLVEITVTLTSNNYGFWRETCPLVENQKCGGLVFYGFSLHFNKTNFSSLSKQTISINTKYLLHDSYILS